MQKNLQESGAFAQELKSGISGFSDHIDVLVFPTSISLAEVARELSDSRIEVGAQNLHQEAKGAFTGEVSADMVKSTGAQYTLVGHSERREYFAETSDQLLAKSKAALDNGIKVVFCCGEVLDERENNQHLEVIQRQVEEVVCQLQADELKEVVVAYEPVWAIGTGKTASPQQAEEMHEHIRQVLHKHFGESVANEMSILYGGSVKPTNATDLFSQPNIDGALVGGASLDVAQFAAIVDAMP